MSNPIRPLAIAFLALFTLTRCTPERSHTSWSVYKADPESTSYSGLTEINKQNVSSLEVAWRFMPKDAAEGSRFGKAECNPIVVDGVMYATSARHRVYALDAGTGQRIWSYDPFKGGRGGGVNRGVTYWADGSDKRILFTAGDELFAVDARTGKPIATFGKDGRVSLDIGPEEDAERWVVPTSPGMVFGDLLILGSEVSEVYGAAPGHIRAFNVRTGDVAWTFHTIPHPGEVGYDTWPPDAWKYVGGANNWGGMSLDERRGIVYLPTGSPTYDYYGADRKGQNLFGNSVIALNARTGRYIWHFQTVHHDLWDYDLPAPPNLVTVERDGKSIDAVAQTTKTGFLFLLNRETGEPLFPIEERPVPASNIPGEHVWPTQPFPLKPAPYSRQHFAEDDLTDGEGRDSVLKAFREFRYEGMFTPPDVRGTFMIPGSRGGSEWGGAAYDPETRLLYINANESPEIARVRKVKDEIMEEVFPTVYGRGKRFYTNYCASCHGANREGIEPGNPPLINLASRMTREEALGKIKTGAGRMPGFANIVGGREEAIIAFLFELQKDVAAGPEEKADTASVYLNTSAYGHFNGPRGLPSIKPPWGTLSAIDLGTGEYAWKVPLGNIPEYQKPGAPPTGTENWGGPMVTAGGLVFIGATRDQKFRAFDKATGQVVWETDLPGHGYATPASYSIRGRQYVVISVTGGREEPGGYIVAFALPR